LNEKIVIGSINVRKRNVSKKVRPKFTNLGTSVYKRTINMPVLRFRSAGPMTLNNYTDDEIEHLRNVDTMNGKIKYITFIKEIGTTGTPHLQIYAQANDKLSIKAWHNELGPRIANIVATIDQEKAIKYCQGFKWNPEKKEYEPKAGSDLDSVFEKGVMPKQGRRTDISSAIEAVQEHGLHKMMITNNEHLTTVANHYQFFKDVDHKNTYEKQRKLAYEDHKQYMQTRQKQPWEQTLDRIITEHEHERDHRTIHWFHDSIGESGKTVNAKQLVFEHNAFYTTGGKSTDIYHAYQLEPIVILNICASQNQECLEHLYKILEEFKDGIFTSGKYGSTTKIFKSPLVIVFSNTAPDETKMKQNRLVVHDIVKLNNPAMETELAPIFKNPRTDIDYTHTSTDKRPVKRKLEDMSFDELERFRKKITDIQKLKH